MRSVLWIGLAIAAFAAGATAWAITQVIAVENVATIERLKLAKIKGGPKAPKPARLNHVLTGVTSQAEYFLKVTGTGIRVLRGGVL